nr:Hypothetical protein CBG06935 [Haemonchus contortus]
MTIYFVANRVLLANDNLPRLIAHDTPLAEEDRIWLSKIAEAVERYKRDPFSDIESTKVPEKTNSTSHNDSDLREKETGGSSDQEPEEGVGMILSYRSSVSLTAWPRNPFKKKVYLRVPVEESDSSSYEEDSEEGEISIEEEEEERKAAYYNELKRRFPCKPDCDHRIFPHCTAECKCDYIYPTVQRFCNPPPLPLFLNTCRLWYNGCPKYARYHYASQYIYSKAEKGKTVPGPHTTNPNPYNIPTGGIPSPPLDSVRLAAGRPTQEQLYSDNPQSLRPLAQSSNTVVIPPPLPAFAKRDFTERTPYTEKRRETAINGLTSNPVGITNDPASLRGGNLGGSDNFERRPRAQQASTHPVVPSDASLGADNTFKIAWGAHWAVPAAGVGGTDGFSTVHFPTIGTFLNIPDDYD